MSDIPEDIPRDLRELATYRDARESTRIVKALNKAADEIERLQRATPSKREAL